MRRTLRLLGRSTCALRFPVRDFGRRRRRRRSKEGRIVDIQFPNGQPLDPADLARVLPLKKGQALRSADVAHAIDALFATGRFDDIVVEAEPAGHGRDRPLCHPECPVSGWNHGGRKGDGFAQSGPGGQRHSAFTGRSFPGRRCHRSGRSHPSPAAGQRIL